MAQKGGKSTVAEEAKYELDQIDLKMLRLVVDYPGITNTELSQACGVAVKTVSRRKNTAAWKKALKDFYQEPSEMIRELAPVAARKYKQLLHCGRPNVEERAARLVLISAGAIRPRVDVEHRFPDAFIVETSDGHQTHLGYGKPDLPEDLVDEKKPDEEKK